MSLYSEFLVTPHRTSSKWPHYFPIYERHLSKYRNQFVTLFEIGVARGGSLQLWKRWLGPHATIVGIDVHDACQQVEEEQIHVRINRAKTQDFLLNVAEELGRPDIVIDDGSHLQPEVNAVFDALFPLVPKNGCYVVEDLHAAYWDDYGGGYGRGDTFVERAKTFIDDMHWQYLRHGEIPADSDRARRGSRLAGMSVYDSVIVLDVGEPRRRYPITVGDTPEWQPDWTTATEPPSEPRAD